jgi:hypothetical protein
MRATPKTLHVKDIWQKYVLQLLAANPDWSTGCNPNATHGARSNFYVYRPYDKFDTKLKNKKVEVINYQQFSTIITDYFERAKEALVQGEVLNLKHRLGKVCMTRVQRNFQRKTVNFHKTRQYPLVMDPVTGKMKREKIIYMIDEEWFKVTWIKTRSTKNEVFYEFSPAKRLKNGKDIMTLRATALRANPKLKYKYLYMPTIKASKNAI